MPRRQVEREGWPEKGPRDEPTISAGLGGGKARLWVGEILLVGIVIFGFFMMTSAIYTERRSAAAPERVELKGHTQVVESVAFSPDGRSLASCGWDNSVRLWDVKGISSGTLSSEPVVLPHGSVRFALAFSPDGSRLVCGGQSSLTIWSCASEDHEPLARREGNNYRCMAFSPDGKTLALGCDDGSVRLLDGNTAQERSVLRGHNDVVRSVAFSPDGSRLVSSGQDREILLWNAIAGSRIRSIGRPGVNPVQIVAFSPLGKHVAVGESSGSSQDVLLVDPETGDTLSRLVGHDSGICALAFSPDGQTLATAGLDRTIKLWNVQDGKERATLTEDVGCVRSLAFSPDGDWLAYAGSDLTIRVWHVSAGKQTLLVGSCPLKA